MMNGRAITVLLLVAITLSVALLIPELLGLRMPGVDEGYEPVQPIAYSHRLHAGELETPCLYCHFGAAKSRNAGIPPLSVCMNCHRSVSAPFMEMRAEYAAAEAEKRKPRRIVSPEIGKIYSALGLDPDLRPDPAGKPSPVFWKRVHNLPDFVYFDHRPHVGAGVACQRCHGPVETMERVRQFSTLTMGWCLDCHRSTPAKDRNGKATTVSVDCSRCHF